MPRGSSKKNKRKGPNAQVDFDILGAVFNMPTRRDIELASERRAAQEQRGTVRVQCRRGVNDDDDGDDTSSSSESSSNSSESASGSGSDEDQGLSVHHQQQQQRQQTVKSGPRARGRSRTVKPQGDLSTQRPQQQQQKQKQKQKQDDDDDIARSSRHIIGREQKQQKQTRQERASRESKQTLSRSLSSMSPACPAQPIASSVPPSASYPSFGGPHGMMPPREIQTAAAGPPAAAVLPQQYMYQAQHFAPMPTPTAPPPVLQPSVAHMPPPPPQIIVASVPPPTFQTAPQQPAGLVSQQIRRIQAEIDQKAALLSVNPNPSDPRLKNDLHALQMKLNNTLNAVLNTKTTAQTTPASGPDQPAQADATTPSSPTARETARPTKSSDIEPECLRRGVSPERVPQHHLCSGCGNVRSAKFHEKHPVMAREKPVLNFCKTCQNATPEAELLEQYHFCFRCGIVRSKEFQRNHPKTAVFPNYCKKCTSEIQSIVGIAEASVLDLNSNSSSDEIEVPGSSSSLAVQVTPEMEYVSAQPLRSSRSESSTSSKSEEPRASFSSTRSAEEHGNARPRDTAQQQMDQPDPQTRSPDRPFFPHRSSGSAQRRAQRNPVAVSDSSGDFDAPAVNSQPVQGYQTPYVEDVNSPMAFQGAQPPRYRRESIFAPRQPVAFDDPQPCGPGDQPSDESSGYATDQSNSDSTAMPEFKSAESKPDSEPARMSSHGNAFEDATRFWRGAFARRESSEQNETWANRASPAKERKQSSSSSSSSKSSNPPPPLPHSTQRATPSPEASGFAGFPNTHDHFTHTYGNNTVHDDDDPPLRTSRGAFGASTSTFRASFGGSRSQQSETRGSHSPQAADSSWREHTFQAGPSNRSFRTSSFANFGSRFASEYTTAPEDADFTGSSFAGYGECGNATSTGCCGSHNPYYIPRKKHSFFTNIRPSAFRRRSQHRMHSDPGSRSGCSFRGHSSRRPYPDWIPEPIIEEPASPVPSPRKRAMLLEFSTDSAGTVSPVPPLSDASSDSSDADALSISDMDDHHCDHSDEDDPHARTTGFCED